MLKTIIKVGWLFNKKIRIKKEILGVKKEYGFEEKEGTKKERPKRRRVAKTLKLRL